MCRLSLSFAAALTVAGCAPQPAPLPPSHPNVVLISLDTVRRDHLPTFGYGRPTAPALDALARRATVFWNAIAQETNTAPSHASMFTGRYPHQHGCALNGYRLVDGVPTLAEVLRSAGFATGAFVSGFSLDGKTTGLDRGFDAYDDDFSGKRRDGAATVELARGWLAERRADRPFFLFVHLYDAHGPYEPKGGYEGLFRSDDPGPRLTRIPPYQRHAGADGRPSERLGEFVDRYDAMIRYADDRVAELFDGIDFERTIVVVLSDHGETLGERYRVLDHGGHVTDEQVRIPLVVHAPGIAAGRVDDLVETVDLLPTLIELVGVDAAAAPSAGRSLAPAMRGAAPSSPAADRIVFSCAEAISERFADAGYDLDRAKHLFGVRSARWKLIVLPGRRGDYEELYDLAADPGETRSLARERPELCAAYRALLKGHLAAGGASLEAPPELDPEAIDKLRSLGYLGP